MPIAKFPPSYPGLVESTRNANYTQRELPCRRRAAVVRARGLTSTRLQGAGCKGFPPHQGDPPCGCRPSATKDPRRRAGRMRSGLGLGGRSSRAVSPSSRVPTRRLRPESTLPGGQRRPEVRDQSDHRRGHERRAPRRHRCSPLAADGARGPALDHAVSRELPRRTEIVDLIAEGENVVGRFAARPPTSGPGADGPRPGGASSASTRSTSSASRRRDLEAWGIEDTARGNVSSASRPCPRYP